MNAKPFIITVIVANLSFIGLHIHKYNEIAQLTDTQVQLQQELLQLQQQEQQLQQELALLRDTKAVTQYAQKYLRMRPMAQRQEQKIPDTAAQT